METPAQIVLPEITSTNWAVVCVALGAGVVASAHFGKLPPALPLIKAGMELGLVLAGWIASMISATGFTLGLVAGAIADRLGQRRVLIFGLLMLAIGSLLGILAHTGNFMLLSRFFEGLWFTATTITGGAIIARATKDKDRRWVLGIWAAYMPLGFASMMIFSVGVSCGVLAV